MRVVRVVGESVGPAVTYPGAMTVAVGLDPGARGWRVLLILEAGDEAVPAGAWLSADFDPGDVDALVRAIGEARDEALRREQERRRIDG